MLTTNIYNHQHSSAFNFQMRTSSGDEINLKGYKESQLEIQRSEDENFQSTSISLRESYKYSFSYVGDGISEQDQKEIDEAVRSMSMNTKQVKEGSRDVEEAVKSFQILPVIVESVNKSAMEVSSIAEENTSGSEEASSAIQQVSASMQQVTSSAQELTNVAGKLKNIAEDLSKNENVGHCQLFFHLQHRL